MAIMNSRKRKFRNEDYLKFIRQLPCCVRLTRAVQIHAHHVALKGMSSIVNDYYAVPLSHDIHISGSGHITCERLEGLVGERLYDVAIFYLSMYIEYLAGRYDLERDSECGFIILKRRCY
jgi:hypothetical protein